MCVRPAPELSFTVEADGQMEILATTVDGTARFSSGPVGTAMWIALRQHDGDTAAAARSLAGVWGLEPVNVRADLEIWVNEMRDAGLVYDEPCVSHP
ncbi:PqqD family protein [Streptomyces tendae]|uniref:PqqD family protein n=1 Tax=Streptomyces TaxID=1883 RepID=UPI002FDC2738